MDDIDNYLHYISRDQDPFYFEDNSINIQPPNLELVEL